jgi:predicted P-loop ATPase
MDTKQKTKKTKGKGSGDGQAPKEHRKSWQELTATVDEIKVFLDERVFLRFNVVTRRVEVHMLTRGQEIVEGAGGLLRLETPPPVPEGDYWQPISDRTVNTLWTELARTKPNTRIQDLWRVIESEYTQPFHPFDDYLKGLPRWDGLDHILTLSLSVRVKGDTDEQLLFAQYLKKWLVGMVAGWVDDKVVNNVILVLIGPQGSYKTTWFNYLLPPELSQYFYTKTNASRMGRDDLLTLAQYGLVCCEELDTMRPAELNQLKAAVTMPSIDERAAYARYHDHRMHIASFCGTGNNKQFLTDPTGNRRWLPFEVEYIDSPHDTPFDYAAVYAQAYALYRQGFRFWFSSDEIAQLSAHNQQYEAPRLEHELVDTYFRRPREGEPGEFMPVSRALQIVSGNISQKVSTVMLGQAFAAQGYEYRRTNHSRGYIVVQRTAQEIRDRHNMLAVTGDR